MQSELDELMSSLGGIPTDEDLDYLASGGGVNSLGVSPQVLKIVEELGSDQILIEAALKWVRTKKKEMTLAKIKALYTQEELNELLEEAKGQTN